MARMSIRDGTLRRHLMMKNMKDATETQAIRPASGTLTIPIPSAVAAAAASRSIATPVNSSPNLIRRAGKIAVTVVPALACHSMLVSRYVAKLSKLSASMSFAASVKVLSKHMRKTSNSPVAFPLCSEGEANVKGALPWSSDKPGRMQYFDGMRYLHDL